MKIKRFSLMILIGTILMTGCGGDKNLSNQNLKNDIKETAAQTADDNVNPAGVFPIVKEPITLKALYVGDPEQEYKDNAVINYIQDTTNIQLDLMVVPGSDYETKKNILIASGDYPEIFFSTINRSEVNDYGMKDDLFINLNPYIDQYGDEIKRIYELRPGYDTLMKSTDGNTYALGRFSECGHCQAYPKLWLNYGWLEKLGLEEPQTTQELFDVLMAFKNNDPNGNGIQDEIPLTGNIDYTCQLEYYLANSFIETDVNSNFINVDTDNKASFVGIQPEFKEALKYVKSIYDEGLIDQAAFTQKNEQMQQTVRSGNIVGAYVAEHIGMGIDTASEDYKDWHALPPVEGPNGVRVQPYTSPTAMILSEAKPSFAITDKCENPAAAFRLVDFLLSEEMTYIQHYGMEGMGWRKPTADEKDYLGNPAKIVIEEPKDDEERELWRKNRFHAISADLKEVRDGWVVEGDENDPAKYELRLATETLRVDPYWDLSHPDAIKDLPLIYGTKDEATKYNEVFINVIDNFKRWTALFIVGEKDIDKDWESYIKELEGYGLNDYLELYQKAFNTFIQLENK